MEDKPPDYSQATGQVPPPYSETQPCPAVSVQLSHLLTEGSSTSVPNSVSPTDSVQVNQLYPNPPEAAPGFPAFAINPIGHPYSPHHQPQTTNEVYNSSNRAEDGVYHDEIFYTLKNFIIISNCLSLVICCLTVSASIFAILGTQNPQFWYLRGMIAALFGYYYYHVPIQGAVQEVASKLHLHGLLTCVGAILSAIGLTTPFAGYAFLAALLLALESWASFKLSITLIQEAEFKEIHCNDP